MVIRFFPLSARLNLVQTTITHQHAPFDTLEYFEMYFTVWPYLSLNIGNSIIGSDFAKSS